MIRLSMDSSVTRLSVALLMVIGLSLTQAPLAVAKELSGFPQIGSLEVPGEPVAVAITPSSDSVYVVSRGGQSYLSVFTFATLELERSIPLGDVEPLAVVSPPSSEGAVISLRDRQTQKNLLALVPRGAGDIALTAEVPSAGPLAIGPFGRSLFIAGPDGVISNVRLPSLELVASKDLGEPIGDLFLSSDETELFVTLPDSKKLSVLNTKSLEEGRARKFKESPSKVVGAPDRRSVLVSFEDSRILESVDYRNLKKRKVERLPGTPTQEVHAPAQHPFFVAGGSGARATLGVISRNSGKLVGRNALGNGVNAIASDPWSRRLLVGLADSPTVQVFDMTAPAPGVPVGLQAIGIARGAEVSWSPDPAPGTGRASSYVARILKTKKICRTQSNSCTFRGLKPGKRYLVAVQGANMRGDGPEATVSVVIPEVLPTPVPLPAPEPGPKPEQSVS